MKNNIKRDKGSRREKENGKISEGIGRFLKDKRRAAPEKSSARVSSVKKSFNPIKRDEGELRGTTLIVKINLTTSKGPSITDGVIQYCNNLGFQQPPSLYLLLFTTL